MRPRGVRDLRHQAVYLFGAVCPARDAGVALVLPTVSAAALQAMLDALAKLQRHPRRLLRRLECPARRNRPHPLPRLPRLGNSQFLMGLV